MRGKDIDLSCTSPAAPAPPPIVSHEMIGRLLVRDLLGEPPAAALARDQPHGAVYEVAACRLRVLS